MDYESTSRKNAPLAEIGRSGSFHPPIWAKIFTGSRFLAGKILRPMLIGFLLILAVGCGPGATPVWPSMTVNSNGDDGDYAPGDGHCQIALNSSVCTLRAAIQESTEFQGDLA